MISPEPRKDRIHQQGIAFISTLVFAILGFVFLSISELEIQKTSREVFRQIDMSSLIPKSLKLSQVEVSDNSMNSVHLIVQAQEKEAQNDQNESDESEEPSDASSQTNPQPTRTPSSNQGNSSGVSQPRNTPRMQNDPGRSAGNNAVESGPSSVSPPLRNNPPSRVANAEPTRSPMSAEGGIPKLPLNSFGRDYKDLDVRQIMDWMKSNPSELPKGIRQLVRFRPTFLSSVATFTMEGKQYELYLMCKESLFEVHVVLVEQNEATYLVDRSFQKLSTYLRKGQVRRTQDNQIIAVRSNMASNDSSDEFYSLFLSWWDWASQVQS